MSHNILLDIYSTAGAEQLRTIDLPITALYSTSTLLQFIENLNFHPKHHHLDSNYMALLCGRGLTLHEGADIVDNLLGLWRMETEVTPRLLLEAVPDIGPRPAVSRALVEAYDALGEDPILVESQVQVQVPPTSPPRQQPVQRRSSPSSSSPDSPPLPYTPPDEVGAREPESEALGELSK